MNWFEQFIYALSGEMSTPTNYGWFHLMFIAIFIGLCVAIIFVTKKHKSEKSFKIIVWTSWAIMFLLEIYKQLVFSLSVTDGVATWKYQWYSFPYQLCSTPLSVLPIIGCLKESKFRDALMSFISTFAFFGGLVVFIYPGNVFVKTIGINLQTMIHHGLQIFIGVYFICYNKQKIDFKYFLKAIYVFLVSLSLAMILNLFAPTFTNQTFNMFYISPYFPSVLPLLDVIYAKVPYICYLLIYIFGFVLAAFIVHVVTMLFTGKFKKKEQTNEKSEN